MPRLGNWHQHRQPPVNPPPWYSWPILCGLILKHDSTNPEFVWGFKCSLIGSKIHYLGQEKSNSLHGSTQVVNIHYLGQIRNLGQNSIFGFQFGNQRLATTVYCAFEFRNRMQISLVECNLLTYVERSKSCDTISFVKLRLIYCSYVSVSSKGNIHPGNLGAISQNLADSGRGHLGRTPRLPWDPLFQ